MRIVAPILSGILLAAVPAAGQALDGPRLWQLGASVGSVFDSNVNHDADEFDAYGVVGGLQGWWSSALDDPLLRVEVESAVHSYSGTQRWDRVSHHARAMLEREFGRWTAEAVGDVSLKGSTEDNGVGDEYALIPRAEFRIDRLHRIRVSAALRLKREDDPDRDALNRYLEAEFRQKLENGRRWEAGYRREENDTRASRNRYSRWSAFIGYATPLPLAGRLELEAKYRAKRYPEKWVEIEDEDLPRVDHQWIPSLRWVQPIAGRAALRLDYRFETRSSNDPEKGYEVHRAAVTLQKHW